MTGLIATVIALLFWASPAHAGPMFLPTLIAFAQTWVGSFVIRLGAYLVLNAIQRARRKKRRSPGIKTDVTTSGGVTPQSFVLGWYATGGNMVCPAMSHGSVGGTPNAYLTYVIDLGDMPLDSLDTVIINDEAVALTGDVHADYGGGAAADSRYAGKLWCKFYDGTQTAADPMLLDKYGGDPDRPWSADMVGTGIPYLIATFRYDRDVYNNLPSVRAVVKGIPLYDPRKDGSIGGTGAHRWSDPATWEFTVNPIVMAYNILRGISLPDGTVWGGEAEAGDLPLSVWSAAMNACEQDVEAEVGKTEPAYRAGFEVSLDDEPFDVVDELMKAASAAYAEVGGVWFVRVGPPSLPSYFFTDGDIVRTAEQDLDPFPGLDDIVNAVHASYPDPEMLWEPKDAPGRYDAAYEAADRDRRELSEIELPAVPYPNQVQRLTVAWLKDARRFRQHHVTLPPDALRLSPLETVSWTSERNGYVDKLFEIGMAAHDTRTLNTVFAIRECDPEDYDWTPDMRLPFDVPPSSVTDPGPLMVPGFAVDAVSIGDDAGTPRRAGIRIRWTADLPGVRGIKWQIRVEATGEAVLSGSTHDIEGGERILSEGILPKTGYQVRGKLITDLPRTWTAWVSVTTPDVRLSPADLVDDLNAKIDTAFDRHDAVIADATGAVGDLRDRVFGLFGVDAFSTVPLAEQLEVVFGPLKPATPPTHTLSEQIGIERDRLDFEIPQIRDAGTGLDDIWERLMELRELAFAADKKFADAGIIVDPDAGTVSIRAVEAISGRQSEVEIKLDAAEAQLQLTATRSYVDDKVTQALLDPTQIPVVNDLKLRVTDLEVSLDAETGRIDLLNETLTVDGALVSMTTVTTELDSLNQTLSQKVSSTEFDTEVARINTVEQTLTTLGDVSELRQSVTASRALADDMGDLTEASIADLWEMWQKGEAIREAAAFGRRQLRASVDEQFAAEASERLQLQAGVDTSLALLQQDAKVRATELEALGEIVDQIDISVTDLQGETEGLATTLEETRARVTETEDGLVAEGTRREFLGATVRDLEGLSEADAEAAIWDLWDRWDSDVKVRDGIAVRLREAASRVEEGLLAEASERLLLGAALDETKASLIQESRVRADGDTALAEQITVLSGALGDAQGDLTELNRVEVSSTSALVQAHLALTGRVGDAEGELIQLNTVNVTSTSALVQAHLGLTGRVDDAEGDLIQLNTVSVSSTSALVQSHLGLTGRVGDAEGELTQLNTVDVSSTSALVQSFLTLKGEVTDPGTGLTARVTALDGVGGRVELTEDGLEALAGRADILEAGIGGQQLIPNGDFAAGDLRGWTNVPATWSVIQRGSTTATAVVTAPRLFLLSIDEDAAFQQATAVADLAVTPGDQVTASIWGATRVSGTAEAHVRLSWADADGAVISTSVLSHIFTGEVWQKIDLGKVTAPAGAASLTIRVRREGGGYGKLYLSSVRAERMTAAAADALARVETIEGAYVDASGAVAAVEQTISAEYGSMLAMAQATSFAKATADGIAAGYVWRLNGQNVMEAVSVADGTDGPTSTFKLAADYVQITGLTQIDNAVIVDLAAANAFIDNLTIGRAQVEDIIQSDDYAQDVDGFPTAGLRLNFATGKIKAARGVVTRRMVVAEGDFDPGVITVNSAAGLYQVQEWNLVATGVQLPVDQVWMPQEKTYIAYAAFAGAATAPGGITGNDEFWGCIATVQPFARWNGPQQLYLRIRLWAKGISKLHATGNDTLPGRIHWKLYEVS